MRISFPFSDYYDIMDDHKDLLDGKYAYYKTETDGLGMLIDDYPVHIPALGLKFRQGELYFYDPENPDAAWDYIRGICLLYDEAEQNPTKYITFGANTVDMLLEEYLEKIGKDDVYIDELECYIDLPDSTN